MSNDWRPPGGCPDFIGDHTEDVFILFVIFEELLRQSLGTCIRLTFKGGLDGGFVIGGSEGGRRRDFVSPYGDHFPTFADSE